jgi:hypothetical protein
MRERMSEKLRLMQNANTEPCNLKRKFLVLFVLDVIRVIYKVARAGTPGTRAR